jgi:hypothetical protein
MIGNSVAASVVGSGIARISKEPDFLGPDEVPMLPEFLINQDPTESDKYHIKMKEWWGSVHENLERLTQMVVSYQVAEAKEVADGELSAEAERQRRSRNELDASLQAIIRDLDSSLTEAIDAHTGRTDNPHAITKAQVGLGNVEDTALSAYTVPASQTSGFHSVATSGDYGDLNDKPSLFSGSYNDLSDKPSLFSGNYQDLSNKPVYSYDATTKTLSITNT